MLSKKAFIVVFLILLLFSLTIRSNKVSATGGFVINQPTYGTTITPQIYPISITVINPLIKKLQLNWWDSRSTSAPCPSYTVNVNVTVWNSPTIINWDSGKVVNATYGMSVYGLDQNSNQIDANGVGNLTVSNAGGDGPICGTPNLATIDTLIANPATINSGESSNISWSGNNAAYCEINGWSTIVNPPPLNTFSGTGNTGSLTQNSTYKLTCRNSAGSSSFKEVTVNVLSGSISPPSAPGNQSNPPPAGSSTPPSSGAANNSPTTNSVTTTTSGEKIISPETVTTQALASTDKLVIEEEIPVSITEFDPDVFLKGGNIRLNSIKNIKKDNKNYIYFEGKTKPNTLVTLYIFSNPIIVTLKSDSKGNWNYEREKRIETGKHSAFATIYDEGVTRRSDVTSFFVAKNSSGNLVLKQTAFDNLLFYGMIIGVVIGFSILILIMYRIYINKRARNS